MDVHKLRDTEVKYHFEEIQEEAMAKESIEVVLIKSLEPCLVITADGVFSLGIPVGKLKDGKMKRLEPDPELGCPTGSLWEKNRAFWLHLALRKDFDPGEHEPSFIAEIH